MTKIDVVRDKMLCRCCLAPNESPHADWCIYNSPTIQFADGPPRQIDDEHLIAPILAARGT